MAPPAVAQHHGLNRGCPVQVVDKVQRRTGGNQLFDHTHMSQVRSGNQRRTVVTAGCELNKDECCAWRCPWLIDLLISTSL